MSIERNRQLARRFLEDIWSGRDLSAIEAIIHPDFEFILPVRPFHLVGIRGLQDLVDRNRRAFQDLTYRPRDVVADDTMAAATWVMSARNVGVWAGFPPSNQDVRINGVTIFKFRDGKVVEAEVQNQHLSLLEQVGAIPKVWPD